MAVVFCEKADAKFILYVGWADDYDTAFRLMSGNQIRLADISIVRYTGASPMKHIVPPQTRRIRNGKESRVLRRERR